MCIWVRRHETNSNPFSYMILKGHSGFNHDNVYSNDEIVEDRLDVQLTYQYVGVVSLVEPVRLACELGYMWSRVSMSSPRI